MMIITFVFKVYIIAFIMLAFFDMALYMFGIEKPFKRFLRALRLRCSDYLVIRKRNN
ncbi:MAG: hypothetical protein ACRCYA_00340 [Cetobacterium sp.]|uniref:hypothetical protein n=1 Tax=Cetobacterium sp. TaxID=2071632 RepID=UPI003F41AC05